MPPLRSTTYTASACPPGLQVPGDARERLVDPLVFLGPRPAADPLVVQAALEPVGDAQQAVAAVSGHERHDHPVPGRGEPAEERLRVGAVAERVDDHGVVGARPQVFQAAAFEVGGEVAGGFGQGPEGVVLEDLRVDGVRLGVVVAVVDDGGGRAEDVADALLERGLARPRLPGEEDRLAALAAGIVAAVRSGPTDTPAPQGDPVGPARG